VPRTSHHAFFGRKRVRPCLKTDFGRRRVFIGGCLRVCTAKRCQGVACPADDSQQLWLRPSRGHFFFFVGTPKRFGRAQLSAYASLVVDEGRALAPEKRGSNNLVFAEEAPGSAGQALPPQRPIARDDGPIQSPIQRIEVPESQTAAIIARGWGHPPHWGSGLFWCAAGGQDDLACI